MVFSHSNSTDTETQSVPWWPILNPRSLKCQCATVIVYCLWALTSHQNPGSNYFTDISMWYLNVPGQIERHMPAFLRPQKHLTKQRLATFQCILHASYELTDCFSPRSLVVLLSDQEMATWPRSLSPFPPHCPFLPWHLQIYGCHPALGFQTQMHLKVLSTGHLKLSISKMKLLTGSLHSPI